MIPASIEKVTSGWLGEVLGASVKGIEVTQIGQGVGLMGDIFRVGLQYESAVDVLPRSVVVKLPSSFEENRVQGVSLGMFEAEVRFYNELAPEATVGLPTVYLAEIVPGTADFVIVMEDLCGMHMVNQHEGMSPEQAIAAVRVLASIHAVWWDRVKDDDAFSWIPTMTGERIEYVDQMLLQILPPFEEAFGEVLSGDARELFRMFSGNYLRIMKTMADRSPWTLAHQDFRVENLMFGNPGSDDVKVIDWQGIGLGPGAYDLAYILGGSMDTQLRRTHESALVRAYHERLVESGVSGYSFEQLWDDYGLAQCMGGLATSMFTGGSLDLSNERGRQLVVTMATRHSAAALDHDGLARIKRAVR